MSYSELIKNFERTRDYMREFYLYGFRSRDSFGKKSTRSYDDERRRIESWLGEYMQFRQTAEGKNVFISIDSRMQSHNPLYKGWKTKSFTNGDITLHFILFDLLAQPCVPMTLGQIMDGITDRLSDFDSPMTFDESTVRKKLKEYVAEGIITTHKEGRTVFYSRAEDIPLPDEDFLDYFSEVMPCGVIGSFILDKIRDHDRHFAFKHHYITGAMDSGIMYSLFEAMSCRCNVRIHTTNRRKGNVTEHLLVPLKIYISVQNGRQYLMAYSHHSARISAYRLDNILSVTKEDVCGDFDLYREKLTGMQTHIWGVSTQGSGDSRIQQVEFTVRYSDEEQHIHRRLEREKRCGVVEKLDSNTSRFSAQVYDASELIPWIRTFICRIVSIHFSDPQLEQRFRNDMEQMYRIYGIGGEQQ